MIAHSVHSMCMYVVCVVCGVFLFCFVLFVLFFAKLITVSTYIDVFPWDLDTMILG